MEMRNTASETTLPKAEGSSWVEKSFHRRECTQFVPCAKDRTRCGCGRGRETHLKKDVFFPPSVPWDVNRHSELLGTDSYGTIEFQGGPHPIKAQYVRLDYETKPGLVLELLTKHWGLELPKLLISVHGGIANFDLQPKLKRVFHKGLFKAAKTTGAWIMTGGTNTGVMYHVGEALGDTLTQARNNIVSIGIAPWGVVHKRNDLVGNDIVTPYHAISTSKSTNVVLNRNHSHFLLVDNGTVGKYGCEINFRKRLEKHIAQQRIITRSGIKNYRTPVVCLVLEGGTNIIRTVLECVTDTPPVPVVVCDGSGRAADILAFTHKYALEDGTLPEGLKEQLIVTIEKTFQYTRVQAEKLFTELMLCIMKRELITVFRMGEGSQDIDLAILTALLKGQNMSAPDQLSLTLAWNRVDIAKKHIFVYGQEWPERALEQAMTDALANDRVDFIQPLLENGVSMQKWLTIMRLEELYNVGLKVMPTSARGTQNQDGASTLRYLIRENKKHIPSGYHYTLFDIGLVMEKLMGGVYRAEYCRKKFRSKYNAVMQKALIACRLYKSMAHEAAEDALEVDISEELQGFSREFANLALDLLEHCYKTDDDLTQQLLTYELRSWSDQTCLALANCTNHRDFLAYTSCQILLTEMWMGGLRTRKYASLKVIISILLILPCLWMEFRSKEELQQMPQTVEEHIHELGSDSDTDSVISDISHRTHQLTASNHLGRSQLLTDGQESFNVDKKGDGLTYTRKLYEFYTAPITKFWLHTIAYVVFLMIMTYVVLVRMSHTPSALECYVIAYVFTMAIEKIRELIVSEPKKLAQKLSVYFSEVWNISDTIAILLFGIGVTMRLFPETMGQGRVFYCVDIVLWYIRILDLFSVNKYLGPFVMMIGSMVKDMLYFIVILLVVLVAFGVVRQSITYPDEEPNWMLLRNIFLKPYFMIYGEVYASEIDPECSDEPGSEFKCVPGRWVTPAVMSIYLIVANILLISILIAVFNNTFNRVNAISLQVWKFQRYSLVLEYESKPMLPPPFIILSHLYLFVKFVCRRCKNDYIDNGLKLFLEDEAVERLHDFEEECMDSYFREKQQEFETGTEERIRVTSERTENMMLRMEDVSLKENSIKLSLQNLDHRLAKLEEISLQNADSLHTLNHVLATLLPPSSALLMDHSIDSGTARGGVSMVQSSHPGGVVRVKTPLTHRAYSLTTDSAPRVASSEIGMQRKQRYQSHIEFSHVHMRPVLKRAGSIEESLPTSHMTSNGLTTQRRAVVPKNIATPFLGSDLYLRRRNSFLTKVRTQDDQQAGSGECQGPTTDVTTTTHSADMTTLTGVNGFGTTNTPAHYTSARQVDDMKYVSGGVSHSVSTADYLLHRGSVDEAPHIHNNIALLPMTPIITPLHTEYTSITDEIDTSCVNYGSPCGSPSTPRRTFCLSTDSDADGRDDIQTTLQQYGAMRSEEEQLKDAEESEHAQMAGVIMRRMRQISMTESDNVVDIVKQVMGASIDYKYSSTDSNVNDLSLDLHVKPGRRRRVDKLKHVQSEPQLKKAVRQHKTLSDDDSEDEMPRCRSTQSLQQRRKLYRHHRRGSRQNGPLHHIQTTEDDTLC